MLFIYCDSDDLYDATDKNNTGNFSVSSTTPVDGPTSSVSPTTIITPEDNGVETPDPGLSTMVITSTTHGSSSTPPLPPEQAPLTSIGNNEEVGQSRTSPKQARAGPAVVGKGWRISNYQCHFLMIVGWHVNRNFCMKDWLEQNLNGLKDAFERHFSALTPDVKKVGHDMNDSASITLLIPLSTEV
jgi:hypothetical protein